MNLSLLLKSLGPSLLYAGAAIGVSHLVQSTSAGAQFGFELVWVLFVANFFKYPFFQMGPKYTHATGKSILEGYADIGKWAVLLFVLLTLSTMFTIQAAVTVVTAGIAQQITGIDLGMPGWSTVLLLLCASILLVGRYSILDKAMKAIILLLTLSTILSLVGILFGPEIVKSTPPVAFSFTDSGHLLFLIAFMGWMPAPIDVSVWHSEWTLASQKEQGKMDAKTAHLEFHIGYWGTALLALGFLTLGALVIYRSGESIPSSGVAFAGLLIKLYTTSLGDWAKPVISIAAFTTMLSTTLTCLDAFPRILSKATKILRDQRTSESKSPYFTWLGITTLGSIIILWFFLKNMKSMVNIATVLSFLTAPLVAWLNLKVNRRLPKEHQLHGFSKAVAHMGMVFLIGFSLYFLFQRF